MKHTFIVSLVFCLSSFYLVAQEIDKCGTQPVTFKAFEETLGDKWGYSYDDLLGDIAVWEQSNYVTIDSIGTSTQNRVQFELIITNETDVTSKHRIYIHTRTHPAEVQSFWVTNEIINFLLGDSPIGQFLRETCVFHIVPMYNPDGVELEYPRENANDIDIESNWNAIESEVEVQNLKSRFAELMLEPNPIEVALNMHSAYACRRYFVMHDAYGTSQNYETSEIDFITDIRSHFTTGIEPYSYMVTWATSTPTQYPESWWWLNFGDAVIALTYEDMNCSSAGFYDKTAFAILHGISDYLNLGFVRLEDMPQADLQVIVYPTVFENFVTVEWNTFDQAQLIEVVDVLGQVVYSTTQTSMGSAQIPTSNFTAGYYFVKVRVNDTILLATIAK